MKSLGVNARFAQLRGVQSIANIANIVLNASREQLHVGTGIGEPREPLHAFVHPHIGITGCARQIIALSESQCILAPSRFTGLAVCLSTYRTWRLYAPPLVDV